MLDIEISLIYFLLWNRFLRFLRTDLCSFVQKKGGKTELNWKRLNVGDALDLNVHLMTTLQTSKGVKAFQIYRRGQCLSAVFLPLVLPSRETINRQAVYPASKTSNAICFTSFFDFARRLNAIVCESNHDGVQEHCVRWVSLLGRLKHERCELLLWNKNGIPDISILHRIKFDSCNKYLIYGNKLLLKFFFRFIRGSDIA